MPSTFDSPPLMTGKRKRAAISYAEGNPLIVDEASGDEQPIDEPASDTDDDLTFGKKASKKRKTPTRKSKSRFTPPKKARQIPEKHFRFLDLSAELRNRIYELTLTDPSGISLVPQIKGYRRTVRRGPVHHNEYDHPCSYRSRPSCASQEAAPRTTDLIPALLAVNKQVHAEGINYLYAQPFVFSDTLALYNFLPSIGAHNAQRLRDLTIKSWGSGRGAHKAANHGASALLTGAMNLETLRIDDKVALYSDTPKGLARTLFRDLHLFLEAYGRAHGCEAAVKVLELGETNYDSLSAVGWRRRWRVGGREGVRPEDAVKGYEAELRKLLKGR